MQLCTERNLNNQFREYFGAKVDVKTLEITSNYFEEAWEEVGKIFKEFSSTKMMKELSPSNAEWVKRMGNISPQLIEKMSQLKNYKIHIKYGYLRGALNSMRANATQDLVYTMNRLYENAFKTLPEYKEPFSPFKILRANSLTTQRLYEKLLQANGLYNVSNEEVMRLIKERTNTFDKVNSILERS